MKSRYELTATSALALVAFAMSTSAAIAGQADPRKPAAEQAALGEDGNAIIVTATRRASPLADVPLAVSAVTGAALLNSGASDIRQLNQLAPSLLVSSTGSDSNAVARVRGIGTVGDNPGLESSVAVFIDGVYRPRTGTGFNELGEVDRIEVLRGPQGTLFGRNTSAGLINIVTKQPSFTLGESGEITHGNYDYWRLSLGITGPVSDTVALRFDEVWLKRDGFLKVTDTNGHHSDTNDRDRYLMRGQALIEPNDALSIRLIGDYSHRDESCCGAVYTSTREVSDPTPGVPGDYAVNASNRIATILNLIVPNSVPAVPDPYSRSTTITAGRDYAGLVRDWGLSGEVNYDFGGAKLTSITAYRDYKSRDYGDYDYTAADLIYRDPNTYRQFKTFTQELRLQGKAFDNKLDWLVGGYYSHEDLTRVDNLRFGRDYGNFAACRLMVGVSATASPLLGAGLLDPTLPGCMTPTARAAVTSQLGALAPLMLPYIDALSTIGDAGTVGDSDARYRQKSETFAAFTHDIVHVTDKLDLTVGLRWTHQKKKLAASFDNDNALCSTVLQARNAGAPNDLVDVALNPAYGAAQLLAGSILTLGCLGNGGTALNGLDLHDGFSDDELSGTAIASYKPIDSLLLYASYSHGYKAGGYNLDRFELGNLGTSTLTSSPATYFFPRSNSDAASLRFEPETVNAYELGLKYSGHNWNANVTAFREEFKDFQLNTFNGTSFIVQNINGCDSALTAGTIDTGGRRCAAGDVTPGLVTQGIEVELSASPVRTVRVSGGLTYADAKYKARLVGSSDGQTPLDPALFLLPGNTNSNAPKWVGTYSIGWTPDIGSHGLTGLVYVDGRTTSGYNTGSDLFPEKWQKSYTVFNARIGLRGPEQRWSVEFWGQNIFNTKYSQITINSPLQGAGSVAHVETYGSTGGYASGTQLFTSYLSEPRTYGITLRGKY